MSARTAGRRARRLVAATARGYAGDRGPQLSAAISYYALFAIFPLTILMVAAYGVVAGDGTAQREVVDLVMRNVPLRDDGRADLQATLQAVTSNAEAFGVVGVVGLVFSASGLMGALRHALSRAFDVEERRPPLIGKLVDVALVLAVGLAGSLLFVVAFLRRFAVSVSPWAAEVVPLTIAATTCALLYRLMPARRIRWRDCFPGAVLAGVGYEAVRAGFSLYLAEFASYGAVYGSIAAVIAFMFFVFLLANVFILGAQLAAAWPHVDGEPDPNPSRRPLGERARALVRAVTGL